MKRTAAIFALLVLMVLPMAAQEVSDGLKVGPNTVEVTVVRQGKVIYHGISKNLITNGGKDWLANIMSATSGPPAQANYIGLTANSTAPAATDTSLTSEINASGVSRLQGTFAHSNGTNTYTLTGVWTASGTVASIQKAGLFNASSSGTMVFETAFPVSPGPITLASGDQLTLTWTITLN